MLDAESQGSVAGERSFPRERRRDTKWVMINYAIIALFNLALFGLTIHGNHKLNTDPDQIDKEISNWAPLQFCLAVSCLTWVALAYGLMRRFRGEWLSWFYTEHEWDMVIVHFTIWFLVLSAAAAQTAFVQQHFYCNVACSLLSSGSYKRNVGYEALAWILTILWIPQPFWSALVSRRGGPEFVTVG